MIKVLWIDDECKDSDGGFTPMGREFIESACDEGIEITAITTYKEGLEAIENNPLKWCAVILDIREQNATNGDAADGYLDILRELEVYQRLHNQKEPYIFTLSGEKQYQRQDSLAYKRDYCSKRVYDKNGEDYKILFNDIRRIKNVSELYKLRTEYKDVIDASLTLGEGGDDRLVRIMYPILLKKEHNDPSLLNEFRKYIEDFIMNKLVVSGFFPKNIEPTLNERSRYIGSWDSKVPEYIKRSFHSLVSLTQEGSHGGTITDEVVRKGKAPFLLRGCLFELLSIVDWIKQM